MGMMLGVSVPGASAMGGRDGEERALFVRLIGEEVDRDVGRLEMVAGMNCGCADGGRNYAGSEGSSCRVRRQVRCEFAGVGLLAADALDMILLLCAGALARVGKR
jgi:hypothetical protein